MKLKPPSLFASLHRWAWRQDENFITELSAAFIRELVEIDPAAAAQVLRWLVGDHLQWPMLSSEMVAVETQRRSLNSIPDCRITLPGVRIDVECKVEQPVDPEQLQRHIDGLSVFAGSSALVLLLRDPPSPGDVPANVFVREWNSLAIALRKVEWGNQIARWLGGRFLRFLEERGLTMKRVDAVLVEGLESLQGLGIQLERAMMGLGLRPVRAGSTTEIGRAAQPGSVFPGLRDVGAWLQLDRPGIIRVQTRPVDERRWRSRERGELLYGADWWGEDLDLARDGFFAAELGPAEQVQWLTARFRDAFEYGCSIAPIAGEYV